MRFLLLLALGASWSASADDPKWSVGQTSLSPEYVFCEAETGCIQRTVKVVDMDQRPSVSAGIPVAIPKKEVTLPDSVTVQFRLASSVLDVKARSDLARFIKAARPHQKFLVTGMTDKLGSARFNERLARSRAAAVKKHLVSNGVPVASILVSATCCVDFPPTENPPARRAVIRLSDPEKTR